MNRYQHRPVANSIFSHVIIDTHTGREIAWCTSERDADRAVRLRNEDEPRDIEPLCAERPDSLDEYYRLVVERDLARTVEIMANAAPQHRVTRQSASPVSRSRPSGRVPTFAREKRA